VHVAGYVDNGTTWVATYWKNGVPKDLTDGTQSAAAFGIVVSGSDVYIAGGQGNVALYWKNGIAVPLTDGSTASLAEAIAINGSDVYVAGYQTSATNMGIIVTYWKNGVAVPLTDGTTTGEATAIAVSGDDVYVAGWTDDTVEYAPNSYVIGPVAKLWKNGVLTPLNDLNTTCAVAESVVVSGTDVYVAGYSNPTLFTAGSVPYTAQYWKNGVAVPLSDGINGAKAFTIKASGSAVYTGGFSSNGAEAIATLWENHTPSTWTSGTMAAVVLSVDLRPTFTAIPPIAYAAGYSGSTAMVWENGVPTALTDGTRDAEARSICVVPH
jgi:hypothetical protein